MPIVVARLLKGPAAWLFALAMAALSGPAPAEDALYYEVPELNAGLGDVPEGIDRTTPRGAVESLLIAAEAARYDDAAHLLNLNDLEPVRQRGEGAVLARKLDVLFSRKVLIDWDQLPDRPDALDAGASDRSAVAGQPRKSILIWTLDLDWRPASIRLDRVRPAGGEPVWVISRSTVARIHELHDIYGPSWLEQEMPGWLTRETIGSLMVWELIGLPILLAILALFAVAMKRIADGLSRRARNPYVSAVVRAIRGPLIFGTVVAAASWSTATIFVFSGRIDAILSPAILVGSVVTIIWLVVNAVDAILDQLIGYDRSDLSRREEQEHRSIATRVAAGRRALIVVVVAVGIGVILSSSSLFQSFGLSLLGTAGALTLILGFAARRVLGNIMASLQIALNQSARIGDRIVWDGFLCHVERINFTFVQLRDWDGTRVIVPVEEFVSKAFVNWTLQEPEMLRILKLRFVHDADVGALRDAFFAVLDELDQDELGDRDDASVKLAEQDVFGLEVWFAIPCADPNTSWDVACDARERLIARATRLGEDRGASLFPDVSAADAIA